MNIEKHELMTVLAQFNPWWRAENIIELPEWQRVVFDELYEWVENPPAARAVLLSGARQVGKTTLLLQVIVKLLSKGVHPANILYATFDHPIIKLAGINAVLEAWREHEPKMQGYEYLLLDEAQFIRDWGTWVKHQVDFNKDRRIIFTGSAMPLLQTEQESGVGRWHTICLPTLSFFEYLQLIQAHYACLVKMNGGIAERFPPRSGIYALDNVAKLTETLPSLNSLQELFTWPQQNFYRVTELIAPYTGYFHQYLLRGGFPQTAQVENINQAQRLLREDIIDKVLKRDMTALFGVRRVLDLEQVFLYLCMRDGGLLDMQNLCTNLEIKRPTAQHFIELLEATHLIYRLQPFGYGKDVLRAKYKIYLADAAIAPAVMLKGKSLLDDPVALGIAAETTVFKHLFTRSYSQNTRFTYWSGDRKHEVDLIAETNNQIIPFEVKYRLQHTARQDLKGLIELCNKKSIKRAYVITKSSSDFGLLDLSGTEIQIMRIPAPLFCYWLGENKADLS